MTRATQKIRKGSAAPRGGWHGRDDSLYSSYRGSKGAAKQAKRATGSNDKYDAEAELSRLLNEMPQSVPNRHDINSYGTGGSRTMNQTRGMQE